jgi:abortive infection bacteriophage resistance protein
MKPSLSVGEQVQMFVSRGLAVPDLGACAEFLTVHNYYQFSGYARYIQRAPHAGDNDFSADATFDEIRGIYEADNALRNALVGPLGQVKLLLRTDVVRAVADKYHAYGDFREDSFYTEVGRGETTVDLMRRDIERSRDRHILHYRADDATGHRYGALPIWSPVEAWSVGTLSLEEVYTVNAHAFPWHPDRVGYRLPTEAEWE